MSGAKHRRKGNCIERELVDRHKTTRRSRRTLSTFRLQPIPRQRTDIDLYPFGREAAPIVAEVKARKNGSGFTQLEGWLGDFDVLFLRRNNSDPLVVLPWRMWATILSKVRP